MSSLLLPTWLQTLHHDGSKRFGSALYLQLSETVQIHLRVGRDTPLTRPYQRIFPDCEQAFIAMESVLKVS